MEEICLRFPHLMEQINEELDYKSLLECKEVCRITCSIIQNQRRFLTSVLIQNHVKNPFEKEWKMVLQKLPVERLNKFIIWVKDFYNAVPSSLPDTQYAHCSRTWLYAFLQTHCKSKHFKNVKFNLMYDTSGETGKLLRPLWDTVSLLRLADHFMKMHCIDRTLVASLI